jgi:hypothetical protein
LKFREELYAIRDLDVVDYVSPKMPKYCLPEKRMLTFQGKIEVTDGSTMQLFPPWSPAMAITAESLVEAGFYYTGTHWSKFNI